MTAPDEWYKQASKAAAKQFNIGTEFGRVVDAVVEACWQLSVEELALLRKSVDTWREKAIYHMHEVEALRHEVPAPEAATLDAMRDCFLMIERFATWGRNVPDAGDLAKAREDLARIGYSPPEAPTGLLPQFFRDEEPEWGLKGDRESWSPEQSAIELIRHLRSQLDPVTQVEMLRKVYQQAYNAAVLGSGGPATAHNAAVDAVCAAAARLTHA